MKKKLCSILLALTMVLTLLPVSALADVGAEAGESTPAEAPAASNVAKIGDQEYATLAEAVAAVADGGTVTLLKNATGGAVGTYKTPTEKQIRAKSFTIDFGGYTYTVTNPAVGSTGYESQAFHLEWSGDGANNHKVTFQNGTIKTADEFNGSMLIQNYCDLTLDNMTIIGDSKIDYVASNNCGNVVIKDSTITAADGKCAFDVYGGFGSYSDVTVTVEGNSVINGKIEVARDNGTQNKNTLNIKGGTINGALAVTEDEKTTVAITGGTFSDVSALDYLADGANVTVKLAADTTKDVTIPAGTTVTLDLNGHKLTNASKDTIINNGNLTITGNGTVDNVTHGKAALINYGTATLNDGNYTRSKEDAENNSASAGENSYYTILNDKGGNLTINSAASVTNVGHFSSMIRNGGTAGSQSTLLINGGRFSGGINTVKNDTDGTLTILGGDFSNTTQYVIMNWNIADIYDGTFEANSTASAVLFSASWEGSAGTLNFHGGNVKTTSESQKAILDYYDASHTGKVAVSGGMFTSDPTAYVANTHIARKDGDAQYTVVAKANLTSGVYMSNPADFLAPGYVSYKNSDDTYTVYYPVPVIPNNNNNSSSTTTKNPDGSTTTTTTDKATGAVTETTTTANGSVGTVKTDANGSTEISASISAADVKAAEQKNAPVIAPITVAPAASSAAAPVIKLSVPANAGEVAVAIPVVNAKQGTVAIKVNPDGTEEIIKTAVITENGLVLGVKGSMQIKVINNSKNFADTVGHWAASDVDFVSARELFNGTAPALFSPEASMTRGMVVTVIARLAGENTDGGANWYDKGCAWAVANGVSDGTNPNGSITREQLAAMLYRYCGSPAASGSLSAYADAASVSAFGSDAMQWCVNNGIINGMDGLLNPQGQATRAQVSAMFARYIRLAAAK